MRRLKIGVWVLENSVPTAGGGYGYYSEMVAAISKTKFENADICFLGEHLSTSDTIGYYKYHSINWRHRKIRTLLRFFKVAGSLLFFIKAYQKWYQYFNKQQNDSLKEFCDIIYYPVPMCRYEDFPFIYTLWDLGHVSSCAFPEFCGDGNFEHRKDHHDNVPFKALLVLCESESGKQEAIHYLRLNESRLKVLPLFPTAVIAEDLEPVKPGRIDTELTFIHYPAQFWVHKNHYNLIYAFYLLTENYPDLKLVLTGSDQGNKAYITKILNEFNLMDKVIDLGFVSLPELKWMYVHSKGLVMPTLLGPTNIPPLEAVTLGCPVAVSDIAGHREQLGDIAIYFDPLNVESIKNAIVELLKGSDGQKTFLPPTTQTNMILLDKYFGEVSTIRQMWP